MKVFSVSELDDAVKRDLETDILAVADTKLVLGNWFGKCVHNGRSLPDFAALLGMCSACYGHTRALYLYLVDFGRDYVELERDRDADGIHSMNLLDAPPRSWEDFIASAFLAEQATWLLISGFIKHPDRGLAGLAEKIGQETYFHLKYAHGWARIFAESGGPRFAEALSRRYPLALKWFGPEDAEDRLHAAGMRDVTLSEIRKTFIREVAKVRELAGISLDLSSSVDFEDDWRPDRRRSGTLPEGLFDLVRFRDAEAVHQ